MDDTDFDCIFVTHVNIINSDSSSLFYNKPSIEYRTFHYPNFACIQNLLLVRYVFYTLTSLKLASRYSLLPRINFGSKTNSYARAQHSLIRWLHLGLLGCSLLEERFLFFKNDLKTLLNNLGCFPLDLEPSHSKSVLLLKLNGIQSFKNIGKTVRSPYI